MGEFPSGTVTFLFTDIEGSTKLWEKFPEEMKTALAKHDSILREAIESNQGHVIKSTGDGIHGVFETAIDAVQATIAVQHTLQTSDFFAQHIAEDASKISLRIRVGLHTGEAELRDGDYYGQSLNRAARIMSIGHGGQVLLSETSMQVVDEHLPNDITLLELGEHYLKGLSRPEKIYQLVIPHLQKDFPPLNSISTATNNLPIQLTSFIGREREVSEAKQKLEDARLLTLIGPGGTGKTRLSLQIGTKLLSTFSDGVWLVELAPVTDPALVLQTIASIFGLREQMGMPLVNIMMDYLRAKNLLLILDNCEHLIDACAHLSEQLLQNAPRIKIIVSSREALGIAGETIYRVPSLSLPDPSKVTFEALAECEAVQLFTERATAANPNFRLNEKTASFVAQICLRLDGIPLALELAAARITVFSVEQIAIRLDDRFKLLTGGSRTALPRQQTLRALIDWSHDMLTEEERVLLRRLSVFTGGWVFEAAESIFANLDILNLLPQLVNKSLVAVDETHIEPRYRLLETVRQYAREKLLESGEVELVRNLHVAYFVKFAENAGPKIDGPQILEWIEKLENEYDNFRTAFDWSMENNVESALRLVGELAYFWFRHGHGAEGIQWAKDALARVDRLPKLIEPEALRQQTLVHARALQAMSFLAYSQGDNINAFTAGDQCIALARQLGDTRMLAIALSFSGSAKLFTGDFAGAEAQIEEAVAITRNAQEKYGLGIALGMRAQIAALKDDDFKAANAFEQEGLALIGESGDTWMSIMTLFGTGRGAMFRGEFAIARERFSKCLPVFEEMGDIHRVNMIYSELAHIDRHEGNYQKAMLAYRKTIPVWQKLGHRAAVAHQFESFAFIAKAQEQAERAARLFGAAEVLREQINIPMSPPEQIEYKREIADLRAGMDEKTFTSIWLEGRTMTMEQAIQLAVSN